MADFKLGWLTLLIIHEKGVLSPLRKEEREHGMGAAARLVHVEFNVDS